MGKQRQKYSQRRNNRGAGGNGEAPNGSANNNNLPDQNMDKYKNGEIPLCGLLKEAIEDIFPELRNDNGNETSVRGKRSQSSQQQQQPETSGSLFGQMIRRKFQLSRKELLASTAAERRAIDDYSFDHDYSNSNRGSGSNNNIPVLPPHPASTTAARKRRRKKKKKRQDSSASLPPAIITNEINTRNNDFDAATYSPSRNGSFLSDGKSMMSTADHSLEALDEAVKTETEKMIELEANHERPLLESLPSDDNMSVQESPSQFIDQIKPQDDNPLQLLPLHARELPLTDHPDTTIMPSLLPADSASGKEDAPEALWKTPLQLPFLISAKNEDQATANVDNISKGLRNLTTSMADKERTRLLLHEWIDLSFFPKDEGGCTDISLANENQDHEKDDWDSLIEFCNEHTAGREKALGIPHTDLLNNVNNIYCRTCCRQALREIQTMGYKDIYKEVASISTKPPRFVMDPKLLEKPSPPTDEELNIETAAAFDYVALEEGNHMPKNNHNEHESSADNEKSDTNLSFLAIDVPTDSKKKPTNKNDANKKNSFLAAERFYFLEKLTPKKLEEFLYEWLIVGVDETRLAHTSIREETGQSGKEADPDSFPVGTISKHELGWVMRRVNETVTNSQMHLNTMITDLKTIPSVPIEMNVDYDFSATNTMLNCEEKCIRYIASYVLPILTRDFTITSHTRPELQIEIWTYYLDILGKTLNACDAYYKKLEDELTEQNGTIPIFVVSKQYRAMYQEYSDQKVGYLLELGDTFHSVLGSLPMREFLTSTIWKQCKQSVPESERSENLDADCRNLIGSITGWTRIVTGGRMWCINKERAKRLEKVFNMLRRVAESLGEEYQTVKRYFSNERQKYFTWLLSNIFLAHGVKDRMRLVEMDDIVGLTTGVILMWRHVRIMQSKVARPTPADVLPLSLRLWALDPPATSLIFTKCLPGPVGAKRRAMGILAGFTYIWLRDRCEEWKSETARRELLTFETNEASLTADPQPAIGGNNKPSKKSKKKKNKNKNSNANGLSYNLKSSPSAENRATAKPNDIGAQASELVEPKSAESRDIQDERGTATPIATPTEGETVETIPIEVDESNQGSTPDPNLSDADVERKETAGPDTVSTDDGPQSDSEELVGEDVGNEIVEDTPNEEEASVANENLEMNGDSSGISPHNGEEDDNDASEIFESRVLLRDHNGSIIPPIEFLTDRLLALMGQPENEKILIVSM